MTTLLQAAAAAIGAGLVVGGFVAGVLSLIRGWDRRELERRALRYGYVGGLVAVALLLVDSVTRYVA